MSNPIIAKTGEDRYCLVKVIDGAMSLQIHANALLTDCSVVYMTMPNPGKFKRHEVVISPGNWAIVGIGKDLDEIQCHVIKPAPIWSILTSKELVEAWLISIGADPDYLILKEVK